MCFCSLEPCEQHKPGSVDLWGFQSLFLVHGSHLAQEGLIDIFSGFFTKGEKAVLSKLETFAVLWWLLSLAGKLFLWLVWRVGRSTNRSLPERLKLKDIIFLSPPGCMIFYNFPAPPYLLQDNSCPEFQAVFITKSCSCLCCTKSSPLDLCSFYPPNHLGCNSSYSFLNWSFKKETSFKKEMSFHVVTGYGGIRELG